MTIFAVIAAALGAINLLYGFFLLFAAMFATLAGESPAVVYEANMTGGSLIALGMVLLATAVFIKAQAEEE